VIDFRMEPTIGGIGDRYTMPFDGVRLRRRAGEENPTSDGK